MFNRIFQYCEGQIESFMGRSICSFLALEDLNSKYTCLLWIELAPTKTWYRIFIDGWYCGIDEYEECNIKDDLDDGDIVKDLSEKYMGNEILSAFASQPDEVDRHIIFTLDMGSSKLELVCKSTDGVSKLIENA